MSERNVAEVPASLPSTPAPPLKTAAPFSSPSVELPLSIHGEWWDDEVDAAAAALDKMGLAQPSPKRTSPQVEKAGLTSIKGKGAFKADTKSRINGINAAQSDPLQAEETLSGGKHEQGKLVSVDLPQAMNPTTPALAERASVAVERPSIQTITLGELLLRSRTLSNDLKEVCWRTSISPAFTEPAFHAGKTTQAVRGLRGRAQP